MRDISALARNAPTLLDEPRCVWDLSSQCIESNI